MRLQRSLLIGFTTFASAQINDFSTVTKSLSSSDPIGTLDWIIGQATPDTSIFTTSVQTILDSHSHLIGPQERAALYSVQEATAHLSGFFDILGDILNDATKATACHVAVASVRGLDLAQSTDKPIHFQPAVELQATDIFFGIAFGYLQTVDDYKLAMRACLTAAGYSVDAFEEQMDAATAELVTLTTTPAFDWTEVTETFNTEYHELLDYTAEETASLYTNLLQTQWIFLHGVYYNDMLPTVTKTGTYNSVLMNTLGLGSFATEAEWDYFFNEHWKNYMLGRNLETNQWENIRIAIPNVFLALGYPVESLATLIQFSYVIDVSSLTMREEMERIEAAAGGNRRKRRNVDTSQKLNKRVKRATSDSAVISTHGCWCPKLTGANALLGKPVSTVDGYCRQWSKCNHCLLCVPDGNIAVDVLLDGTFQCNSLQNSCTDSACQCILDFATQTHEWISDNDLDASLNAATEAICSVNPVSSGSSNPNVC